MPKSISKADVAWNSFPKPFPVNPFPKPSCSHASPSSPPCLRRDSNRRETEQRTQQLFSQTPRLFLEHKQKKSSAISSCLKLVPCSKVASAVTKVSHCNDWEERASGQGFDGWKVPEEEAQWQALHVYVSCSKDQQSMKFFATNFLWMIPTCFH